MSHKILLIDDDQALLNMLQFVFKQAGYQVETARSGLEGLQKAFNFRPDLVVMDVAMPVMDGMTACERLRELTDVPIIMVTARTAEEDVLSGFRKGADDYVTKPFRVKELLARVEALLRRTHTSSQMDDLRMFRDGEIEINFSRRLLTVRGQQVKLTPIEFDLLSCLARNAGRVVTRETLLSEVWGQDYAENTQALKLYIRYLRQKIEQDPANPEYILTEWGVGYKFEL